MRLFVELMMSIGLDELVLVVDVTAVLLFIAIYINLMMLSHCLTHCKYLFVISIRIVCVFRCIWMCRCIKLQFLQRLRCIDTTLQDNFSLLFPCSAFFFILIVFVVGVNVLKRTLTVWLKINVNIYVWTRIECIQFTLNCIQEKLHNIQLLCCK